jgi:hypothetical protein
MITDVNTATGMYILWICTHPIIGPFFVFNKVGKTKRKPCPECGKLLANVNEHVKSVHWQVNKINTVKINQSKKCFTEQYLMSK